MVKPKDENPKVVCLTREQARRLLEALPPEVWWWGGPDEVLAAAINALDEAADV